MPSDAGLLDVVNHHHHAWGGGREGALRALTADSRCRPHGSVRSQGGACNHGGRPRRAPRTCGAQRATHSRPASPITARHVSWLYSRTPSAT